MFTFLAYKLWQHGKIFKDDIFAAVACDVISLGFLGLYLNG